MTRDEIYEKVKGVLVEALGVDDDEVEPSAVITTDLGAESIDFLDIVFQLEQAFGFKIAQGELFPEGVTQDATYVQDGKVTDKGISELKAKMPHFDFTPVEQDRSVKSVVKIFTVDAIVSFCQRKLATKG